MRLAPEAVRALSGPDFAAEAGASPELVARLVEMGALRPLPDGRFDARDEILVSTVRAMLEAGINLDDFASTLRDGRFGIQSLGQTFSTPEPRTTDRYADLVASLGPDAQHVPAVYAALGMPEPDPNDHPRRDEAEIVMSFVRLWSVVDPSGAAHVRVARLIGDGTRRVAEGLLDVWDEVAMPDPTSQGAPTVGDGGAPVDPTDPEQNLAIGMSAIARRLVSLVHERQMEATLNTRIINAVERVLGEAGLLPARPTRPPAVAFIDLAGFTTLTEERGDEAAARAATTLHDVADVAVRRHGGRIVKQLGDGVLVRLPDAASALRAVADVVAAVVDAGLPQAHAGIAAGSVIVRDGDIFGRTVNLAARLAAAAPAGATFVEEGVVVALPRGTARFDPLGRLELPGFAETVAVWRVQEVGAGTP